MYIPDFIFPESIRTISYDRSIAALSGGILYVPLWQGKEPFLIGFSLTYFGNVNQVTHSNQAMQYFVYAYNSTYYSFRGSSDRNSSSYYPNSLLRGTCNYSDRINPLYVWGIGLEVYLQLLAGDSSAVVTINIWYGFKKNIYVSDYSQ